jgi:hypothetical protein
MEEKIIITTIWRKIDVPRCKSTETGGYGDHIGVVTDVPASGDLGPCKKHFSNLDGVAQVGVYQSYTLYE